MARQPKNPPRYAVPALDRGLDIIETLSQAAVPLTLSEVAQRMKLSPGIVYRLLHRLEERTFIVRDPATQRYSLSLRLYALALAQDPLDHLVSAARLPLADLANTTQESCFLSVLVGRQRVVIAAAHSPLPIRLSIEVGSSLEAGSTNSGRLLVAMQPATQWDTLAPKLPTAELQAICEHSYAESHSDRLEGVHDIAIPVRLPTGFASIGISYLTPRNVKTKIDTFMPAMLATAREIERTMGLDFSHKGN